MCPAVLGSERLEHGLDVRDRLVRAAGHQAEAFLQTPDPARDADVEEVDALLGRLRVPALRVVEVRVAAVDDRVPGRGEVEQLLKRRLRDPEQYQYDFNLRDIAEVWRRGSVIASWLLDLTAAALVEDAELKQFAGRVSDSGEGRWTIKAAIDEAVPVPVLSTALYQRFSSRGESDYQDKLLSAMRYQFGGHLEKPGQ